MDVLKTHYLIQDYLKEDYYVLYYGLDKHPESVAALSIDPEHIFLIRNEQDLNDYLWLKDKKVLLTNQTTLSYLDAKALFEKAQTMFDDITLVEEICNATRVRQQALDKIESDVDLVYIVGDPKSNNSNKLALITKDRNFNVQMIESVNEININDLKDINKVAVSSGASTPTYLTSMVIEYLKQFDYNDVKTHPKPIIDLSLIL
ncbi:MAG: 4-hydroxy-3-methylbut-2-enyl diphosphate reductase, partial [Bacilli bacterium]